MTVFLTKVWGFSEPCGPLQFSQPGWRDGARKVLQDGDLVILVGTLGERTAEEERGRVLGMMEPTREVVLWTDFVREDIDPMPEDFNSQGEYKWPYGLINRRAWIFENPKPYLKDISDRSFEMDSASGIVPLNAEEADRILKYKRREISLIHPIHVQARLEGIETARRKNAPPPTTTRTGVMHMRRAPAYTYAMRVENASEASVKIGWAFDYAQRQRLFNQHAMPELGGLKYRTLLYHLWPTAKDAFLMEQKLLRIFDGYRHPQNREIVFRVSQEQIETVWKDYVQLMARR